MLENGLRLSQISMILIILLSGFALRATLLQATANIPLDGDEKVYYKLGNKLVDGFFEHKGIGSPRFLKRAPILPFILAGTRLAIGPGPFLGKWAVIFFSIISIALGYNLARRIFGLSPGIVAAFILAIYPEFVVHSTLLLTETPFITLTLTSLLLLVDYQSQPRPRTLLLTGLFWATTILTRDEALYFTLFIALWIAWYRTSTLSQRLAPALAFLAVVAIGLSPWVARNLWVTGRFAFVTQREGLTLFQHPGNHDPQLDPEAWCAQYYALGKERAPRQRFSYTAWAAQQRFAAETVVKYVQRNPGEWALNKLALLWRNLTQVYLEAFPRLMENIYGSVVPHYLPLIIWSTAIGFLLFSIGWILGVFSAPPSPGRNLLYLWLVFTSALYILVALQLRSRPPLLAILALFSASFWGAPITALQTLRTKPIRALPAIILLILLFINLNPFNPPLESKICIRKLFW